ncbi:MAG: Rad52/Rad22 family DNA repair protein [Bacteroidota bacterium]
MAVSPDDLRRLSAPFPNDDIEWKPGATTRDRKKGLAMAYLTSRAIQDRLDEVCGPGNWRNGFAPGPEGGVLCGLSILVHREGTGAPEWVTKWDGAENTEFESVKGGLSGALKRAAVQWGIGRYLYSMPAQWVPLDERGRFASPPRVPAKYLPESHRTTRQGTHNERPPADPFGAVHGDGPQRGSPPSNGSQGDSAPRSRASNTRVIRKANGQRPR